MTNTETELPAATVLPFDAAKEVRAIAKLCIEHGWKRVTFETAVDVHGERFARVVADDGPLSRELAVMAEDGILSYRVDRAPGTDRSWQAPSEDWTQTAVVHDARLYARRVA